MTADAMFDVHSVFTSKCLLKSWRAAQLAEVLAHSLSVWNLSVAVGICRALVERASAWALESSEVTAEWMRLKSIYVLSMRDAIRVRDGLNNVVTQLVWGTRLEHISKSHPLY